MNVLEFIRKFGTANPFSISKILGITYLFVDLPPRLFGRMITDADDKPVILLNNDLIDSKMRYTVMAHELLHAMEHVDLPNYYSFAYGGKGKLEREADLFASRLMYYFYKEEYMEEPESFERLHQEYGVKEDMADYILRGD